VPKLTDLTAFLGRPCRGVLQPCKMWSHMESQECYLHPILAGQGVSYALALAEGLGFNSLHINKAYMVT